jgi:hypothetical protein
MVGWKKPLNQPAKQAERVLAPGDGEAEPGVTDPISKSLRSWRQMVVEVVLPVVTFHLSPTSWAGTCVGSVPQARLRHRLGLSLSPPASQAS